MSRFRISIVAIGAIVVGVAVAFADGWWFQDQGDAAAHRAATGGVSFNCVSPCHIGEVFLSKR